MVSEAESSLCADVSSGEGFAVVVVLSDRMRRYDVNSARVLLSCERTSLGTCQPTDGRAERGRETNACT